MFSYWVEPHHTPTLPSAQHPLPHPLQKEKKNTEGLDWFYLIETSPFILTQLRNTNMRYISVRPSTLSAKHHSKTKTLTKLQWNQCNRKPQNGTRWIWPHVAIARRQPSKMTELRESPCSVWYPTHPRTVKEGIKAMNHKWVNDHVCS